MSSFIYFLEYFFYHFKDLVDLKKLKTLYTFFYLFLFYLQQPIYIFQPTTNLKDKLSARNSKTSSSRWDDNFSNEIKIVVGDEWFAGNLSYHLRSRPKWKIDLKSKNQKLLV